jgi:hypothetical protein
MTTFDKEALKQVLKSLDQANDALWTDDGSPLISEVQRLANDKTITRVQINDAIPGFARKPTKGFVEEPPDETGDEISLDPLVAAQVDPNPAPVQDEEDDDIFSSAEREDVKAIAQRRVLEAELALTEAKARTVEAYRAERAAELRFTKTKNLYNTKFPPMSAAENIKQHIARQQEVLRDRVLNAGGFVPNIAANPIDQRLMDRGGRSSGGRNQRREVSPSVLFPRKSTAVV